MQNANDSKIVSIKGEITAKFWKQNNPLLRKWNNVVEVLIKNCPSKRDWLLKNFYSIGELVRTDKKTNIICNAGLARVTGGLADDLALTNINKMLLGDATGATAVTRTTLYNEVYRNSTASATHADNIVYATAYFTQTEVVDTFQEFGNVIAGDAWGAGAGKDTGYLWSHITGLTWVKDNVTTLTVDCKYTFASI